MIVMVEPSHGGTITVKDASGIIGSMTPVAYGSVVVINAIPNDDHYFVNLVLNNIGTRKNPCKYKVTYEDIVLHVSATFCLKHATCFLEDMPVLTPSGYRPIATLHVGDSVTTGAGGISRIRAIKAKRMIPYAFSHPYVIPIGLYGAWTRLLISPHHRVKVGENCYMEARFLGLQREIMMESFTYYNLELEDSNEDMIVAGVTVETWNEVESRL